MVASLWSNSAYDESKGDPRSKAIRDIESSYSEALEAVERSFGNEEIAEQDKLDKENPFFQAAERGLEKVDRYIDQRKGKVEKAKEDAVDPMEGIDQG